MQTPDWSDSPFYVWPDVWSGYLQVCNFFFKSMVIHDTECPYWDQVSLNDTTQPKPHIDSKCMFHAVLELIQGRAAGAGLSATNPLEDCSCPPATAGREEEGCGVHLGGDKVYVPRTCGSNDCEHMCISIPQWPWVADTKSEKWGNHPWCCCQFAEPNSSAALWTYCGKYTGQFITRLSQCFCDYGMLKLDYSGRYQ